MPTVQPRSVVYYNFFLNMRISGRITAEQLLAKVPKYLTQEDHDIIIAIPLT